MALARVKTWISGEVLFAADLNGEFNNVLNNALALISPLTGNLNFNNTQALSFRLENLGATPAGGQAGRLVFQTSQNQPEVDDGAFMRRVPAVQTTTIATGDLITASTAGTWIRLAVGSSSASHLIATSSSSVPIWGGGPASTGGLEFARAWVVFSGITTSSGITPLAAFGVSTAANTIIKNSSGNYTIPWSNPFSSSNYALVAMAQREPGGVRNLIANTASSAGAAVTSSAATIVLLGDDAGIYDSSRVTLVAYGAV